MSIDERVAAGTDRLTQTDAGELLTLQLAAWVREARENGTIEIPPLREDLTDVRGQLDDPAFTVWGFRESGRLLATVRTAALADSVALIARLGVVPDLIRQGVGGAMLRLAEGRLPAAVARIELITGIHSVSNHAFYARYGYQIIGQDAAGGTVRLAKNR